MGNGSFWQKWIPAAKVCLKFLNEWRSLFIISQISKNPTQSQHWPRFIYVRTPWCNEHLMQTGFQHLASHSVPGNGSFVCCPAFEVDCTSIVDMFLISNDSSTDRKKLSRLICMDQQRFWEGDIHSAFLHIPHILRKPKVHYRGHNSQSMDSNLKQTKRRWAYVYESPTQRDFVTLRNTLSVYPAPQNINISTSLLIVMGVCWKKSRKSRLLHFRMFDFCRKCYRHGGCANCDGESVTSAIQVRVMFATCILLVM
jgi:hypothetical protein